LNAAYHWPEWWQGTVGFLQEAGFDVLWAGNFVDQGWFTNQEAVNEKRWVFDGDLAAKSFTYVAHSSKCWASLSSVMILRCTGVS